MTVAWISDAGLRDKVGWKLEGSDMTGRHSIYEKWHVYARKGLWRWSSVFALLDHRCSSRGCHLHVRCRYLPVLNRT